MRKKKSVFMFLLMISLIFSLCKGSVYAQTKNEIAQLETEIKKNNGFVEFKPKNFVVHLK